MRTKLWVPDAGPLADFLPMISMKRDELQTETRIADEHAKNNKDVRDLLMQRGIQPEALPPAEDIKKVERRVVAEAKKLTAPKQKK